MLILRLPEAPTDMNHRIIISLTTLIVDLPNMNDIDVPDFKIFLQDQKLDKEGNIELFLTLMKNIDSPYLP
jgi:hypothetical protein